MALPHVVKLIAKCIKELIMARKMKRYNGEEGSKVEMDPLEAVNASDEARDIAESVGTGARNMDVPKAMPKAAAKPKAAPKLIDPSNIRSGRRSDEESQMAPADKTKMSVADRAKASRESARAGSGTTDRRSVSQRLRAAFGMKNGGSASSRADGIASRGKTNCKMY
jgi:hypothetical protein